MLYIVCLAYVGGVLILAQRCAHWYRYQLLCGYIPDKHALASALVKAVTIIRPTKQPVPKGLNAYQRYLLLIGFTSALTVLSLYVYFYAVTAVYSLSLGALYWQLWVLLIVVLLACIDLKTRLLPDALCMPLLLSALLLGSLFSEPLTLNSWSTVGVVAAIAYGVYALSYYLLGTPALGLGDVKLYVALSACLPTFEAALQVYFVAGMGCWFTQALWQRRWLPRGSCAFGPYLGLGYLFANVSVLALQ